MQLADDSLRRLTNSIERSFKKQNIESTLELISAKAKLLYTYNQKYRDEQSEILLDSIAGIYNNGFSHDKEDGTVLFYDGFGLDTRGLVQQYLTGLIENNYKILYVTVSTDVSKQPRVEKMLKQGNSEFACIRAANFNNKIVWLRDFCLSHSFSYTFMYTTPWDVAGIVLFNMLRGKAIRYQINLTDHAFWLGTRAFDYCVEFRNYGAAITRDYRNITENKLVCLPYYPIVNENENFQGFPESIQGKKVIFSGGSPYKTVDSGNTFYKLVESILDKHNDVAFLYAGNGTVNGLESLTQKYPERAVHVSERSDLLEVMKHSRFFLNTYPISGALMLQYAALSGCIPVTLKREWDDDTDGLLLNEEALQETFTEPSEVIEEIDRLLGDEDYYLRKKRTLEGQVLTSSEFASRLNQLIENPTRLAFTKIDEVDTQLYRKAFAENLTRKDVVRSIIRKDIPRVWSYFPNLLIERLINESCGLK